MQLILSYLRYTVPPEEQGVVDDGWIGSLLTVSPFLRLVEYFSAEIGDGGNQRMQRKDFMHNFDNDIMTNEKDDMNSLVFENAPNWHAHASADDIWFNVAREELVLRGAIQHATEKIWIWNQIPLVLGCLDCQDDLIGWHAWNSTLNLWFHLFFCFIFVFLFSSQDIYALALLGFISLG